MRVDGSCIPKEKVADSKISGYVWAGSKMLLEWILVYTFVHRIQDAQNFWWLQKIPYFASTTYYG